MDNEQPNKTDTKGAVPDKAVEKPEEPLSLVDEAKKVRDEIRTENDRREEILKEEQKLTSEKLLGGTSGGHIEPVVQDPAKKLADEMVKAFN